MFDIDSCYGLLASEKDSAYFWSGLGKDGESISTAIANENGGVTLAMLMHEHRDQFIEAGLEYDEDLDRFLIPAENFSDWEALSNAFAEQASGDVHAVLGDQVREDSIWSTKEFPALCENDTITKVTSVDPTTGREKGVLLDRTGTSNNNEGQFVRNGFSSSNIASIGGGGARAPNSPDNITPSNEDVQTAREKGVDLDGLLSNPQNDIAQQGKGIGITTNNGGIT